MMTVAIGWAVVVGVMLLFFGFGWIVPLAMGISWRRKNQPGARGLLVFASIWGTLTILIAASLVGLGFFGSRISSDYVSGDDSEVPVFEAVAYKGETATLRTAFPGDSSLTATCGMLGNMKFSSTNGSFTVPAGSVLIHSYQAVVKDPEGRTWTARTRLASNTNALDVAPGTVRDIRHGPPLTASVKVSLSGVSDEIEMEPIYADRDGNGCTLSCEPQPTAAPRFQLIDPDNRVVWSGDFQYG
jgi:hypothetical protein